jgi:hypothetical protein
MTQDPLSVGLRMRLLEKRRTLGRKQERALEKVERLLDRDREEPRGVCFHKAGVPVRWSTDSRIRFVHGWIWNGHDMTQYTVHYGICSIVGMKD